MDKLKELLTKETSSFSATTGVKYLAEFIKNHPEVSKNLEQPHAEIDVMGIDKNKINSIYEVSQPFHEQISPIIADMFLKIKELQKVSGLDASVSLPTWLGGVIVSHGLMFMMHECFIEADNGEWNNIQIKMPEDSKLPVEMVDFIRKAAVAKTISGIIGRQIGLIMNDFMAELKLPGETKT